jgi:PAS domain S-box-containing protein
MLETILSASADQIYIFDRAGRFLYANRASLESMSAILQKPEALNLPEIFGKTGQELGFSPDVMEPHQARLERVFLTGQPLTGETTYPFQNEIKHHEYTFTPIYDADGCVETVIITSHNISERKRAEAALQESNQRIANIEAALRTSQEQLQAILDNSPAVIYLTDVQNRYLLINRNYENLFGLTKEQLLGKSIYEIWSDEIADSFAANNQKVLEGGTPIKVEEVAPQEDGVHTYISIKLPLQDANGVPYAVCGISTDITERKPAEEELRKSEERWQLALKGNNEGIWDLNLKTNEVFRAARYKEILGYEDHELGNDNDDWVRRIHPDDFDWVMQANQDYLERKIPYYAVEYRLRCKDGSYKWVMGRAQAVWDEAGKPVRMVGSTTDISDRKSAEEALRESEQQFREIFEHAPLGLSLINFQTHQFLQVNPAYYQLLGYSETEIASLTFDEITHPDDLEQDLHYMEQINQSKIDSFRIEKRYLRKNGEVMWGNLTLTVLRNPDGKPGFCLGMIEDITERKHAEDQIKASLQEKETLLKEIHHRVKNNLQIISSLLRLQSRQLRDQQAIALFKESQNRVQAMALIHEKLYQSSNLAQIDFQEYIKTLVQALFRSYDAHRRGVTFKCNVEPISLAIDIAIPCGLIINELVSNSLKYAFPETLGGEICISLQSLEHRFSNPGKTSPPAPFLQKEGSQTPPSLQGNRSEGEEVGGLDLNYRIDVLEPQSTASVDQGQFILTISDNGVGLSENFDFRNTSSLGLQLVCRLTKQLEASIELNRSYGTEYKISFRNPKPR